MATFVIHAALLFYGYTMYMCIIIAPFPGEMIYIAIDSEKEIHYKLTVHVPMQSLGSKKP